MTVTSMVPCVSAARAQARAGHIGRALVGGLRRGDDHGALASDGATASCVVLGRHPGVVSLVPVCLFLGVPPFLLAFLGSPLTPRAQCLCFLVSLSLRPRLSLISRSILHHHSPRIPHHPLFFPLFWGTCPGPGSWFAPSSKGRFSQPAREDLKFLLFVGDDVDIDERIEGIFVLVF